MSTAPNTDPEFADFTMDDLRAYLEAHGGGIEIAFRGTTVLAPRLAIVGALEFFRDELPKRQHKAYRREVMKQIDKVWADVAQQRASTETAILMCEDIGIIFALDVFEGKIALPGTAN